MIWVLSAFVICLLIIFLFDWDKTADNIAKWLDDDNPKH